jgi:polyisoprenoid-binding protein YceI
MDTMTQGKMKRLIAAAVVVVVVLAGGAYGVFALLTSGGAASVADTGFSPLPSTSASAAPLTGGTNGTWTLEASSGSFVGYRIREKLAMLSAPSDAVGRTTAVQGSLSIKGTDVTAVDVKADLTQLTSDESRRDDRIRTEGLESDTFPDAEFTLTSPISLGKKPAQGKVVTATAQGTLNLHGVTKDLTITVQARWSGSAIQVIATIPIAFADYGIVAPNSGFVSVEDHGTIETSLTFTKS